MWLETQPCADNLSVLGLLGNASKTTMLSPLEIAQLAQLMHLSWASARLKHAFLCGAVPVESLQAVHHYATMYTQPLTAVYGSFLWAKQLWVVQDMTRDCSYADKHLRNLDALLQVNPHFKPAAADYIVRAIHDAALRDLNNPCAIDYIGTPLVLAKHVPTSHLRLRDLLALAPRATLIVVPILRRFPTEVLMPYMDYIDALRPLELQNPHLRQVRRRLWVALLARRFSEGPASLIVRFAY